jgi:hypothetical protein
VSKLLRERIDLECDRNIIKEMREKGQPIILRRTLLQRANAKNQNGRIYPRKVLEREVENYSKLIPAGRSTGQLDHIDNSVIELQKVSHIIREIHWEGNDVYGAVEIINTPMGKIAQELLEAGVKVGISSRGVGDTLKNDSGDDVVGENFTLICWDLVGDPSTHGAFLSESKDLSLGDMRKIAPKNVIVNRILDEILRGK